jgi:hypothetical protein
VDENWGGKKRPLKLWQKIKYGNAEKQNLVLKVQPDRARSYTLPGVLGLYTAGIGRSPTRPPIKACYPYFSTLLTYYVTPRSAFSGCWHPSTFTTSTFSTQLLSLCRRLCTQPLQTSPSRQLLPQLAVNSHAALQPCASFAASTRSSLCG